jgi:peptidoglycan/xylan/chitin deacetylase (PgdA/CDA1 family)
LDKSKAWYRSRPVDVLVRLLYYSGLLHLVGLVRRHLGPRRLLILLYHRLAVTGETTAISGLELDDPVPVERFERHLRVLRWFGEPLPLNAAFQRLHDSRETLRTFLAITFDDGYRDNYTLGRPIWTRHGIPVTLFPAIAQVDRGEWLWWDELARIVGAADFDEDQVRSLLEVLDELAPGPAWTDGLAGTCGREAFARFLFARMVRLPVDLREAVLGEVARHLATVRPARPASACDTPSDRLYIDWEELRDLAREGVEIGGHTVRHPRLPCETAVVAEAEITTCRKLLWEKLQKPINCFAMPGGFYDDRDLALIARAGYRLAVTVEKGVNYRDTNPYRLRRISLSWDEPHHLAFKLAFADWLFPHVQD